MFVTHSFFLITLLFFLNYKRLLLYQINNIEYYTCTLREKNLIYIIVLNRDSVTVLTMYVELMCFTRSIRT